MGSYLVHPTGTTHYDPSRCWNGYTVFNVCNHGVFLIDMNGRPVHVWSGMDGFPAKLIPGGRMMGSSGRRPTAVSYQDQRDVVTCRWDGSLEWKFTRKEFCDDPGLYPQYMARQHHDYQRYGEPVYYTPAVATPYQTERTLVLTHEDVKRARISPQLLEDDVLLEVDNDENILWRWSAVDHFDAFGFNDVERNAIFRNPNTMPCGPQGQGNWIRINAAAYLGENPWYAAGDQRFHPDNILLTCREGCLLCIISRETGEILWRLGPDYSSCAALRALEPLVGPHAAHLIPSGLPGAGNLLVFDNGGWAGYGAATQLSRTGHGVLRRDYSRVLELNPLTFEVVWSFDATTLGFSNLFAASTFYSPLISTAQRRPNGNTLINEGCFGNLLEVTAQGEVVWNYVNPYPNGSRFDLYRAYRVPYDWVPQLPHPAETPVARVDNFHFQLPGAADPTPEPQCSVTFKAD